MFLVVLRSWSWWWKISRRSFPLKYYCLELPKCPTSLSVISRHQETQIVKNKKDQTGDFLCCGSAYLKKHLAKHIIQSRPQNSYSQGGRDNNYTILQLLWWPAFRTTFFCTQTTRTLTQYTVKLLYVPKRAVLRARPEARVEPNFTR